MSVRRARVSKTFRVEALDPRVLLSSGPQINISDDSGASGDRFVPVGCDQRPVPWRDASQRCDHGRSGPRPHHHADRRRDPRRTLAAAVEPLRLSYPRLRRLSQAVEAGGEILLQGANAFRGEFHEV